MGRLPTCLCHGTSTYVFMSWDVYLRVYVMGRLPTCLCHGTSTYVFMSWDVYLRVYVMGRLPTCLCHGTSTYVFMSWDVYLRVYVMGRLPTCLCHGTSTYVFMPPCENTRQNYTKGKLLIYMRVRGVVDERGPSLGAGIVDTSHSFGIPALVNSSALGPDRDAQARCRLRLSYLIKPIAIANTSWV
ncbi:hypothetical protein Bpfe_009907 [Biomphalaria pfeifferi]|uniref:Uncharacterized protein n=1 Tax=Biomphalaria pfeifferi TaxID=112525 RepID=A0AAD8BTU3_BIOPF|nr:hypothetical protein Bpfe_009907 [Biomphalaria pfeifferi]